MTNSADIIQNLRDYIDAKRTDNQEGLDWNYNYNMRLNRLSAMLIDASVYPNAPLAHVSAVIEQARAMLSAMLAEKIMQVEIEKRKFFFRDVESLKTEVDYLYLIIPIFESALETVKDCEAKIWEYDAL